MNAAYNSHGLLASDAKYFGEIPVRSLQTGAPGGVG